MHLLTRAVAAIVDCLLQLPAGWPSSACPASLLVAPADWFRRIMTIKVELIQQPRSFTFLLVTFIRFDVGSPVRC